MPSPRSRRILYWVAVTMATLSLVVLIAAWGVSNSFEGRAVLAQRVQVDKTASDLFGDKDANVPIGSPQMLVIDDKAAFLPGVGPNGSRLVSETYLQDKKIYPLQIKTVRYVAGLVRLVAGIGLVVGLAIALWVRRKLRA